MPSKNPSSAVRRSSNGFASSDWPGLRSRQSKTMKVAGVSTESRVIRLSAGCSRICSASKESPPSTGMTSSPSSTKVFAASARRFSSTSGKKRESDFPDLALISTSSPARKARQRKPSHLGSYCQPASLGSSLTSLASIGSRSSGMPSAANPPCRVLSAVFIACLQQAFGSLPRADARHRNSPPRLCSWRASAGTVLIVKRVGSRPSRTWFQFTGIETGAPGRPRGDSGATAVDMRSLRR